MHLPDFSQHENIAFVANGQLDTPSSTQKSLSEYRCIVAVDGGLNHCHQLGIKPQLLVGDWDSADPALLKQYADVPRLDYLVEKDKTDLELALAAAINPITKRFTVFAGLGGRTDHLLVNINLLSRFPGRLFLESGTELLWAIQRECSFSAAIGQTLSLIPLNGPVKEISTTGLKWELSNGTLDKHFLGISNICLQDRCSIVIKEGDLLCCLQKQSQGGSP